MKRSDMPKLSLGLPFPQKNTRLSDNAVSVASSAF